MNNEFDNTTDDQIITMLRNTSVRHDPLVAEAAERMAGLLDMMRRMAMTPPGADRIEATVHPYRASFRMSIPSECDGAGLWQQG